MKPKVLITGSSTGIGKACALYLNEKGFSVFAGVRKPADGVKLQQEEPAITPVILDVTSESDISSVRELLRSPGD